MYIWCLNFKWTTAQLRLHKFRWCFSKWSTSSRELRFPRELLVFHQALGVFPCCPRYNYWAAKMTRNISPIFVPSSPVHSLRSDCKIIWSMIEWSNRSSSICINRIYEFFSLVIFHILLLCHKTRNTKNTICVALMNDKKLIFGMLALDWCLVFCVRFFDFCNRGASIQ